MGQCTSCNRKKIGSGLCNECKMIQDNNLRQHQIESIKANLSIVFDNKIQTLIMNRFGMSEVTSHDRLMIGKLTKAAREEFRILVSGINRVQFEYVVPSANPNSNLGNMDWSQTLEKGHRGITFIDKRAERMNQCYLLAAYKTDIYCGASSALRAGRNEDAARAFEELTLFEEAGRVRKMALQEKNTSRNVSVNMNQLLDQVRQGGLALPYKCPSCGGSIKIDKDFDPDIKVCGYCGTPLDTTVISTMLKNI